MKLLGAHLSVAKGLHTITKQMELLDCNSCAIFLKSPRMFKSKDLDNEAIKKFIKGVGCKDNILPHGSYLINLANPEILEKSYECFVDDLRRCLALGIRLYNLHPGKDVKGIGSKALSLIAEHINRAHNEVPSVIVLLENMAGQGSEVGRTFEELSEIIEQVDDKSRVGVTFDTCHAYGAGYDISTAESFESVMKDFDKKVGLKYLKAVHLNDSKFGLNSRKDRHEEIGKGMIGLEAFRYIMNSPYFEDIPLVLETPFPEHYKNEISLLRGLQENAE